MGLARHALGPAVRQPLATGKASIRLAGMLQADGIETNKTFRSA